MKSILISNIKGGTGKSTVSTNLAAYFALTGYKTALMDYDKQSSATYWAKRRQLAVPQVQAINACNHKGRVTRSFHLRPKAGTERVVIDTPAGYDILENKDMFRQISAMIIPLTPSSIDIHATSHYIARLLEKDHIRSSHKLAVVANRVKEGDRNYEKLRYFIQALKIPFLGSLKDSDSYLLASEESSSVFEINSEEGKADARDWRPIVHWVNQKLNKNEEILRDRPPRHMIQNLQRIQSM